MKPPAFKILSFSTSRSGLWSLDRLYAWEREARLRSNKTMLVKQPHKFTVPTMTSIMTFQRSSFKVGVHCSPKSYFNGWYLITCTLSTENYQTWGDWDWVFLIKYLTLPGDNTTRITGICNKKFVVPNYSNAGCAPRSWTIKIRMRPLLPPRSFRL